MFQNEKVDVYQMLEARDRRVVRQKRMLLEGKCPVICFTLNIPGPVKTSSQFLWAFERGRREVVELLQREGYIIKMNESEYRNTGFEYMASVEADPIILKRKLTELEEKTPLGRLYDIDVISPDGKKVSRNEIGKGRRKCILCEEDAHVCGRNRTHTIEELIDRVEQIILEEQKEESNV